MPRRSKLLPYLRLTKSGRLEFVRRVPPELQKYLGERKYFTHVLTCESTDVRNKAVIRAWSEINAQTEAELAEAKEKLTADHAPKPEPTPLAPRDAAGIAAEPWRQLVNAVDTGQLPEGVKQMLIEVVATAIAATSEGSVQQMEAAKAVITQRILGDTLSKLQIQPDAQALEQIQKRLFGYVPMASADLGKREAGDFSPADTETKAPPLPKTKVTFDRLIEAWLADAGGITEQDGVGVSSDRVETYRRSVTDLIFVTERHFPAEVGVDEARQYYEHLQAWDTAVTTKQSYLGTLNNLYSLAVRLGLLDVNPFREFKIKIPKGTRQNNYRAFTSDELTTIFSHINTLPTHERKIVPLTLLMTGARLSDVMFLRHIDVKKTENGVNYFDFVHKPTGDYPHLLKGGESDERHTPLHPLLVERGFLEFIKPGKEGYVFETRANDLMSGWFKRMLERLGIYEKRVTTLHSFRGTAIDAWRAARLPEDVRRALTAHSSRDVQDKVYGEGLRFMPDVLYKEISKVDWSWLP